MASGLSMPIGLKNGTDGNLQIAIDAMRAAQHEHSFLGIDEYHDEHRQDDWQSERSCGFARRPYKDEL